MKKICFVLPTLQKGGMERVVTELSNHLVNTFDITIICAVGGEIKYNLDSKVRVIANGKYNKLSLLFFLTKAIRDDNADVVIGFSEFLNPYTIISSKLNSKKVLVSDRSNPIKRHNLRDRIMRKLTYRLSNGLLAQTNFAKEVFTKRKFNKVINVLSNPLVNIENSKINHENKGILMVGRLTKSKNQKEIIEIFSKVLNEGWTLYIVGGGKEREFLENFAISLGIGEKVIFTGEVDDVESYMRKCSIFAYTSLSEGFPNALNEAMAFPLASIAYDCKAGVSDLIENNVNGFLVKEGDKESFIVKLQQLMIDANLRKSIMEKGFSNRVKYNVATISRNLISFIS